MAKEEEGERERKQVGVRWKEIKKEGHMNE